LFLSPNGSWKPGEEEPMSVIFTMVMAMLLHLKRKCPECKREQIVPSSHRKQTVACKFCGAKIPPPK
jgi:ribosomal protein S27E